MKIIRLTIYDPTHIRLNNASWPAGMNLTRWINLAMNEKLDRDCPSTIGLKPAGLAEDEPEQHKPIDPYAILAAMRAQEKKLDVGPVVIRYKERFPVAYAAAVHNCKTKKEKSLGVEGEFEKILFQDPALVLTEEQKREIMAEHGRLQAEKSQAAAVDPDAIPDDVRGHPIKYREWRDKRDAEIAGIKVPEVSETGELSDTAEYLALCKPVKTAKLAEDEEDEFWGGYEKTKRAASK